MPENLTEIRDSAARDRFLALLLKAVSELRAFNLEPIVIASCPAKFNDAFNDQDWEAIQVGSFFSERTSYFSEPTTHQKRLDQGPENARTAARILRDLEASGWREIYQTAFARSYMSHEEVSALVLQDGRSWFIIDGSNDGESAVYAIESKDLRHAGHAVGDEKGMRFDQRIGEDRPLLLRTAEESRRALVALQAKFAEMEGRPEGEPFRKSVGWRIVKEDPAPPTFRNRLGDLERTGRVTNEEYGRILREIHLNNLE